MIIKEFIVHQLEKQVDSTQSRLQLSKNTIPSSAILEGFLDELNKIYNSKASKVFGGFAKQPETQALSDDKDEAHNIQSMLNILSAYSNKDMSFIDYTCQSMEILKHYIEMATKATGGYMLFAHYSLFGSDFMLLAMLNNVSGISIDSQLDISAIDYLDINKLHLAARIDLTQWQEDEASQRYISMVRTKESHKLSDYFKQFIGSDETSNSTQETNDLFTAIGQFCDNKFDQEEHKSEFKKKAADYCIDQAEKGQAVDLKDFSNYVAEGAVDDFMNYVNSEQFQLNNEMSPNKSVIRRFNKITGRNAQMSITINEEALGHSIIYDADKEVLTISDLPATLKAQLVEK